MKLFKDHIHDERLCNTLELTQFLLPFFRRRENKEMTEFIAVLRQNTQNNAHMRFIEIIRGHID